MPLLAPEWCPGAPGHVLFLEEAIRKGIPVTRLMRSPANSRKGGSIVNGMWAAAQEDHERHVVVFTAAGDENVRTGVGCEDSTGPSRRRFWRQLPSFSLHRPSLANGPTVFAAS